MPVRDDLGTRMKKFYEEVPKYKLYRRTPVAIRIDGKAFHTFTKGFEKPFDTILMTAMQNTMKYLCENIQGCVLGYTQSDEITLILVDYQTLTTDAWFDYEIQKICSISASMATMAFNKFFAEAVENHRVEWEYGLTPQSVEIQKEHQKYMITLGAAKNKGAMFDARCSNIPKEEVCNLIYWRQLDATRNSIQMVGQAYFSHNELQGKSCNNIQDMLMDKYNINWNNYPIPCKRGTCCIKTNDGWMIDRNIPIFKNEDRNYIDKLIFIST